MIQTRDNGFTMIELLVVMALGALLLVVALPNLRPQVAEANAKSVADNMADALRFARQFALDTSGVVSFAPSGCGYTVSNSIGTQLKVNASSPPTGVSCVPLGKTLVFLGDGSVPLCAASAPSASPPTYPTYCGAQVTGGGQSWAISVSSGGIVSETPQ